MDKIPVPKVSPLKKELNQRESIISPHSPTNHKGYRINRKSEIHGCLWLKRSETKARINCVME